MTIICSPQLYIRTLGRCPSCKKGMVVEDVVAVPSKPWSLNDQRDFLGLPRKGTAEDLSVPSTAEQHCCGTYLPESWREEMIRFLEYQQYLASGRP